MRVEGSAALRCCQVCVLPPPLTEPPAHTTSVAAAPARPPPAADQWVAVTGASAPLLDASEVLEPGAELWMLQLPAAVRFFCCACVLRELQTPNNNNNNNNDTRSRRDRLPPSSPTLTH